MKKITILFLLCCFVVLSCLHSTTQIEAIMNQPLDIKSSSYILVDMDSQTILLAHNEHEKLPVASICKLMTTLLTMEKLENGEIHLEDMVTASPYACSMEGSQAFLDAGSQYSVEDLLKSVIVASANDSSVVLAELIAGTEQNFTKLMNEKALSLGMNDTVYVNANGLPAMGQHSTAYDTAILLKEVSKYDLYHKYCQIWMDQLVHPSGRVTELVNTNRLIKYYDKCISGKTGFTDEAGYCLASHAKYNNLNLIAVVLQCDSMADRFNESVKLLDYGFANYETKLIVDASQMLEENFDVKRSSQSLQIRPIENYYLLSKKGEDPSYTIEYEIKPMKAPIYENDVCGKLLVIKDGVVVKEISLVASHTVLERTYTESMEEIIKEWSIK